MKEDGLSEKELQVLTFFITTESFVMDNQQKFLEKPIIFECKDGKEHYLAYPAKVAKDFSKTVYKKISKKWAGTVCSSLYEKGILNYEERKPPRQKNTTEHYFLKSDLESFRKITNYIVKDTESWECKNLFSKAYFQKNINENLIKEIMAEKKVEIGRDFDFWHWKPSEAEQLFAECNRSKEASFDEYIQKRITENYYSKDSSPSLSSSSLPSFSPGIMLRLPIFKINKKGKDNLSTKSYQKLLELNKHSSKDYPSLKHNKSGIIEHYTKFQRRKWIIPLLALIKSSPIALQEFLNGDWDCSDKNYCSYSKEGRVNFEYPFFRLLFAAISDIALTRDVENGDVSFAELRSSSNHKSEMNNYLLKISMKSWLNVYFDGGFNTHHDYYGTESGDVFESPNETYYWAKAWIDYPAKFSSHFLGLKDITNFEAFVDKLIDKDNQMGKFIFDNIANYMKNILLNLKALDEIPESLKEDLLFEINDIIFDNDFSKEKLYDDSEISEYTKHEIDHLRQSEESDFYEQSLIHLMKNGVNRLILEDVFEGIIDKNSWRLNREKEGEENDW